MLPSNALRSPGDPALAGPPGWTPTDAAAALGVRAGRAAGGDPVRVEQRGAKRTGFHGGQVVANHLISIAGICRIWWTKFQANRLISRYLCATGRGYQIDDAWNALAFRSRRSCSNLRERRLARPAPIAAYGDCGRRTPTGSGRRRSRLRASCATPAPVSALGGPVSIHRQASRGSDAWSAPQSPLRAKWLPTC